MNAEVIEKGFAVLAMVYIAGMIIVPVIYKLQFKVDSFKLKDDRRKNPPYEWL